MIQKCQVGLARSERVGARATEWVAEKEKLQKSLEANDGLLKEAVSKNAGLVVDLEKAQAEVGQLREEAKEGAIQNATLFADLDKALSSVEELEADAEMLRRGNTDLATDARLARRQLEDALKEKAAELESALAKQKAKLEEKYRVDFDAAIEEEVRRLAADYRAQLPGIRDQAWEL